MTDKHSPGLLTHLAVNKLVDSLQHSSRRLDNFIASEILKRPTSIQKKDSSRLGQNIGQKPKVSENADACPLDHGACTQAALQMMNIRTYMMDYVKPDLQPLVIRHAIARAIESRNIPLVRLVLKDGVTILDFRALDYWLSRCTTPSPLLQDISSDMNSDQCQAITGSSSMSCNSNALPLVIHCLPPDEFDWFSRDRLGKIISMPEACELFSIIGMSQSAPNVQELYMNSRRATYWACSQDLMEITADTLLQMPKLSTLVLRGMADDYMLKLVGQTATGLKRLDVSGSHFVTDEGIKNLFFKEITENPATYLIASWIQKNIELMNPLVLSLETLDYSWTSVTALSRKMVQILPGSYMFKRVFARSENDAYGHHIFIRRKADFTSKIRSKLEKDAKKFQDGLTKIVGTKGSKAFIKLVEHHPWRNCILSIHVERFNFNDSRGSVNDSQKQQQGPSYGIITPNVDERRVHGVVNFQSENLVELYSVYPININLLGETCPKLRVFRGILNDSWKMRSSLMPELTCLDIFADPMTIKNLLESSPNLKKVRIRVIRQTLTDDHLIKPITSSMCRRTLEEIWIAPGSYKSTGLVGSADDQASLAGVNNQEVYYAASNPPRLNILTQESISNTSTEDQDPSTVHCPIDDLVNLSIECIRTLIASCSKLRRLGDIAWWTPVTQDDLERICNELKDQNSKMSFVWENHLFPDITEYTRNRSSPPF